MKTPYLTVCLCVEDEEQCVLALHQIAAGHVFGSQQRLRLELHSQNLEGLYDLVTSVHESCYDLVEEISVAPTVRGDCDVMLIFLSSMHPKTKTPNTALMNGPGQGYLGYQDNTCTSSSIGFLHNVSNHLNNQLEDTLKVLVLGPNSNAAASVLSHRLGCMGGNQLLAFQPKETTARGQYGTANALCRAVSDWWTGNQDTSRRTTAGIKFLGKHGDTPILGGGLYFSAPVDITGEKTFKVCEHFHIDSSEIKKALYETESAFDEMNKIEYKETSYTARDVFHAML